MCAHISLDCANTQSATVKARVLANASRSSTGHPCPSEYSLNQNTGAQIFEDIGESPQNFSCASESEHEVIGEEPLNSAQLSSARLQSGSDRVSAGTYYIVGPSEGVASQIGDPLRQ